VRPNVEHAERYPWEFVGKPIPLPLDALNPKVTEVEKMVLPTSPLSSSPVSPMATESSNKGSPPRVGNPSSKKKSSRSGSSATTAGNETTAGDGSVIGSDIVAVSTSNRLYSLSQSTPPPPLKPQ
jgi:hypothetical protein